MVDEGLELGTGVLIVLDLRLLDIVGEIRPSAVTAGQRGIEVVERSEVVAAVLGSLVVGVVLVVVGLLPQVVLLGRGHETVDGIERRNGVPSALLTVVAPRASCVGLVSPAEVRGVVPIVGRHPVVRALLLA